MFKKSLSAVGIAALAGAVFAQIVIGSVTDVKGLVTVSDATSVTTVVKNAPIVDGTRFVTSSSGSAMLRLNQQGRDCEIELKPNQSLVVDQDKTCPQLLALVLSTSTDAAAVAIGGTGTRDALLAGLAITVALIAGKTTGGSTPAPGGGEGNLPELPPLSGQ